MKEILESSERQVRIVIDTCQLVKQMKKFKKALKSEPLIFKHFSDYVFSNFSSLSEHLVFSESRTTIAADGVVEIIKTIRFDDNVDVLTLAFWTHKRDFAHQ